MPSPREAAEDIATHRRTLEPGITRISLCGDSPIRLLEVTTATVPAGIVPVWFGPAADLPFAVVLVAVTPEEYRRILDHELHLPDDWTEEHVLFDAQP